MHDDTLIPLDDWRRDHLPWRLAELAATLVDGGIATKDDVRRAVDDRVDEAGASRLLRPLADLAHMLVEEGIATMADVRAAFDDQLADAVEPQFDDSRRGRRIGPFDFGPDFQ
jgi:hypothetical protein